MFDSRSLRRKLGNLIPNDARKQIQNVLTVEWDTHKTVLVEVPGAPPVERDTDMEMEGMGLNRRDGERDHGYGRLDDDWDDHEDLMNPNMPIEPPRRQASGSGSGSGSGLASGSSSNQYFDRPVPRPQSRTSSSDKRLPPVPAKEQDPFAHDDDFVPSNSFLQPKRERESSSGRVRTMDEGWNTFGTGESRDSGKDVWKSKGNSNGNGGGVNSPTSSRGTRDSAQTSSEENPFR